MEPTANPWLAIDAATPAAARARELRREWEHFLSGDRVSGVRPSVADSWERSAAAGVDAAGEFAAPVAAERDEALTRWEFHPLREAAPLIHDCLAGIAHESDHLIIVSDADGVLLQLEGNARVRSLAADSMNFTEGSLWSEDGAGTNAIGTALAEDHALQVFATEHFVEVVQAWTCSAAPVHDPDTGELLGVIDLTGLQMNVHPDSLAAAVTTARAVEGHLRYGLRERDRRLFERYRGRLAGRGSRRALVAPSGRLVADDSRGWLFGTRIGIPPGGGEIVLRSGERAIAEPVGSGEAFVLRELVLPGASFRPARDERQLVVEEQAALRRLATAAARGVSPMRIFAAVAEEIRPLLGADDSAVVRFDPGDGATVVAGAQLDDSPPIAQVFRTGRPARVDRDGGIRSAVASPILVEGRIWGALLASTRREPLAPDTEERMAHFTELVGIVIANAESRAELTASRARVVAAGDEARRRIQRDLHDGAQQRLVSTVLTLKLAREELGDTTGPAAELVEEALANAEEANAELRELAHGILPAALSRGGLRTGIEALVSRVRLPVSLDVSVGRLPPALEATAYFIVAEALTNTVKHAGAGSAVVTAAVDGGVLRLEVRDDGVGGARIDRSSGLLGLRDRAAAVNGELRVDSPPGRGTLVAAALPVPGD